MVGQSAAGMQKGASEFLVFQDFEGMNTQSGREGLSKKQLAWLENLQPYAPNWLLAVPAPSAALAMLTGETVLKLFYATFASVDWIIAFCQSGAAYGVNIASGNATKFAAAGTFSAVPDCTQFASSRLLIFDPAAGYCTWNGSVFVQQGGVSPQFTVTAGGSGYTAGATVTITGGTGTGAAAAATVVAGVVTAINLTASGSGYLAGDTLTVTLTANFGGSGATATGHVWPFVSPAPTTGCVAFGRVWMASGRTIILTGTGGFDDFGAATASVTTTVNDADLVHAITALRFLNNYVYIIGDNSVKSVGSISVSGTTTSFTIVTLTSDQGTTFQQTIISFNRLILFANTVGVYAVFGASVEKISDPMDGVFRLVDFTQPLSAAVNDINNVHTFLLQVRYKDPLEGPRTLLLSYSGRKWFVTSQGDGLLAIVTAIVNGTTETFGSSGADVTQLLQDTTSPVEWQIITALVDEGDPLFTKRSIRAGCSQSVSGASSLVMTVDTELSTAPVAIMGQAGGSVGVIWTTGGKVMNWTTGGKPMVWGRSGTSGFLFAYGNVATSGKYIGATLSGLNAGQVIQNIAIEYQRAQAWS